MPNLRNRELPLYNIDLPQPPIGNKIICLQNHGIYVLQKGPTIWRALANTHTGTGVVAVYDGVPDDNGFFPEADLPISDAKYATSNGRLLFYANPSVLGMWMLDGGCLHGLTIVTAGDCTIAPFVTVTWMPDRKAERRIVVDDAPVAAVVKLPDEEKRANKNRPDRQRKSA